MDCLGRKSAPWNESEREIHPLEVVPHHVQRLQPRHAAQAQQGLGRQGGAVAGAEVHVAEGGAAQLQLQQLREPLVAQLLLAEGLRAEADGEAGEVRAALPEDHERVVVAEVVEADAGELRQFYEQGAELRLPDAVRQLEEEAEPLLVDLIGLEHELPDVGVEGVRGDQVEEHLPAPVAAQELSQHQLVAAEECPPRLEHILGGIFAGFVTTSPSQSH